jgi:hypothetical protein
VPKNRTFLLVLVCAALGALVLLDHWKAHDDNVAPAAPQQVRAQSSDVTAAEASAPQTAAGRNKLVNPLADFDKSRLKAWSQRPLFAPSRARPPQPAVAAAAPVIAEAPPPPPPSYELLGVVRTGERAVALLRKRGEGTSFRVEVGDMIGGWRVAKLEPASVVLQRMDGTSETVPIKRR